ncbi:MAG: DUF2789 family protein [Pedobacter sp.]|nr:DUF2789 family protein [Pedobacter sp.]
MDTGNHDLPALFAQLGLASDQASINLFLISHELPAGTSLAKAEFWTPSQAKFLADALQEDAEWAEAADEMAMLLTPRPGH